MKAFSTSYSKPGFSMTPANDTFWSSYTSNEIYLMGESEKERLRLLEFFSKSRSHSSFILPFSSAWQTVVSCSSVPFTAK